MHIALVIHVVIYWFASILQCSSKKVLINIGREAGTTDDKFITLKRSGPRLRRVCFPCPVVSNAGYSRSSQCSCECNLEQGKMATLGYFSSRWQCVKNSNLRESQRCAVRFKGEGKDDRFRVFDVSSYTVAEVAHKWSTMLTNRTSCSIVKAMFYTCEGSWEDVRNSERKFEIARNGSTFRLKIKKDTVGQSFKYLSGTLLKLDVSCVVPEFHGYVATSCLLLKFAGNMLCQADIKIRALPTIPSDPGPTTTLSPTGQQTSSSSTVTGLFGPAETGFIVPKQSTDGGTSPSVIGAVVATMMVLTVAAVATVILIKRRKIFFWKRISINEPAYSNNLHTRSRSSTDGEGGGAGGYSATPTRIHNDINEEVNYHTPVRTNKNTRLQEVTPYLSVKVNDKATGGRDTWPHGRDHAPHVDYHDPVETLAAQNTLTVPKSDRTYKSLERGKNTASFYQPLIKADNKKGAVKFTGVKRKPSKSYDSSEVTIKSSPESYVSMQNPPLYMNEEDVRRQRALTAKTLDMKSNPKQMPTVYYTLGTTKKTPSSTKKLSLEENNKPLVPDYQNVQGLPNGKKKNDASEKHRKQSLDCDYEPMDNA